MVVLDAIAAAAADAIERIRIDLTEIDAIEDTVVVHIWLLVDPLYLRVPCFSLPVLRDRLL
jgi:hypothetical protein